MASAAAAGAGASSTCSVQWGANGATAEEAGASGGHPCLFDSESRDRDIAYLGSLRAALDGVVGLALALLLQRQRRIPRGRQKTESDERSSLKDLTHARHRRRAAWRWLMVEDFKMCRFRQERAFSVRAAVTASSTVFASAARSMRGGRGAGVRSEGEARWRRCRIFCRLKKNVSVQQSTHRLRPGRRQQRRPPRRAPAWGPPPASRRPRRACPQQRPPPSSQPLRDSDRGQSAAASGGCETRRTTSRRRRRRQGDKKAISLIPTNKKKSAPGAACGASGASAAGRGSGS